MIYTSKNGCITTSKKDVWTYIGVGVLIHIVDMPD